VMFLLFKQGLKIEYIGRLALAINHDDVSGFCDEKTELTLTFDQPR